MKEVGWPTLRLRRTRGKQKNYRKLRTHSDFKFCIDSLQEINAQVLALQLQCSILWGLQNVHIVFNRINRKFKGGHLRRTEQINCCLELRRLPNFTQLMAFLANPKHTIWNSRKFTENHILQGRWNEVAIGEVLIRRPISSSAAIFDEVREENFCATLHLINSLL